MEPDGQDRNARSSLAESQLDALLHPRPDRMDHRLSIRFCM
jgi:hypothetical protein